MTVSVQCLGPEPDDNWGAYNWNAFVWGAGTATVPKVVVKGLPGQSVSSSDTRDYRLTRLLAGQSIGSADARTLNLTRLLPVQSIGSADQLEHEYLQDPNGYYHVFPEGVTDATLSTTPTWSSATSTPVTWTTQAAGPTTWS